MMNNILPVLTGKDNSKPTRHGREFIRAEAEAGTGAGVSYLGEHLPIKRQTPEALRATHQNSLKLTALRERLLTMCLSYSRPATGTFCS